MKKTLIKGGTVIDQGKAFRADIIISNDIIETVCTDSCTPRGSYDNIVDAAGCIVIPGVIDTHVHFRDPGLTHKADIHTESRAAAAGGVTSYFDMPNTIPTTTTQEALEQKIGKAKEHSLVNYAFFPGATNNNTEWLESLDPKVVPGIKLFMGSSTGNMLVDKRSALEQVFAIASQKGMTVVTHCEDTDTINANMAEWKNRLKTDDPDVKYHHLIRSAEACVSSSKLAIEMALEHSAHLHIAHITTKEEMQMLQELNNEMITCEATPAHLLFTNEDYATLGTKIKCNPAVKTAEDRGALRSALASTITTIATDHAPHTTEEKQGGAAKAVSGMPMLQFSLPVMLTLADEGVITHERVVELMCNNPAHLFNIDNRGRLAEGCKADMAIVKNEPWTVEKKDIISKCGWSPLEGKTLNWKVKQTFCNGQLVYDNGEIIESNAAEQISFR